MSSCSCCKPEWVIRSTVSESPHGKLTIELGSTNGHVTATVSLWSGDNWASFEIASISMDHPIPRMARAELVRLCAKSIELECGEIRCATTIGNDSMVLIGVDAPTVLCALFGDELTDQLSVVFDIRRARAR